MMSYRSRFKPGDFVTIYVNPSAKLIKEGRAILREFVSASGGLELWNVEFLDQEGKLYPRYICSGKYRLNVV